MVVQNIDAVLEVANGDPAPFGFVSGSGAQVSTFFVSYAGHNFAVINQHITSYHNAGDVPIRQWMSTGDYKDIPEFVESIPYTETREYVQAILRNREIYHALYATH